MNKQKQLSSVTIFFPFLNDEGTVAEAIDDAYRYGRKITGDLEIIAINGGVSKDNTFQTIQKQKQFKRVGNRSRRRLNGT